MVENVRLSGLNMLSVKMIQDWDQVLSGTRLRRHPRTTQWDGVKEDMKSYALSRGCTSFEQMENDNERATS